VAGKFCTVSEQCQDIGERCDAHHRKAIALLHLLHCGVWRKLAISARALHPVHRDQHGNGFGTGSADDVNGLGNRSTCRNDVINDDNPPLQGRAHQQPALAMVLGLFAVIRKRDIPAMHPCVIGKRHGRRSRQRDPLVGWPEQHVERHGGIDQCLRVKLR
jgi:hypothetical protein